MQCRLQIGHTGLDVVHNSGDRLCMPGREVVPGLSLEEPLPTQGATMMLSSICELEGVELELGSCCSDLDKQVSDEICLTRFLRSHFVFRTRHALEWLCARFLPVVFLANEEELTGKTFPKSLNTANPNTYVKYVKFIFLRTSPLRWLGTVVTSHTASNRQVYTPVMSMLQKAVQSTHCTSCNQPAHTNAIMLYAVKCSLYLPVGFYAGYCIKVGLQGWKCDKIAWCAKTKQVTYECFR